MAKFVRCGIKTICTVRRSKVCAYISAEQKEIESRSKAYGMLSRATWKRHGLFHRARQPRERWKVDGKLD